MEGGFSELPSGDIPGGSFTNRDSGRVPVSPPDPSSSVKSRKLLGEILLERGLISEQDLSEALELQKISGSPLGEILVSRGLISPLKLYEVLAEQGDLSYIGRNLEELYGLIDEELLKSFNVRELIHFRFFPIKRDGGHFLVAVVSQHDSSVEKLLGEKFGLVYVEKALITPYELDHLIHRFFGKSILHEATAGLLFRSPQESASRVFTPLQWLVGVASLVAFLWGLIFFTLPTLSVLLSIINLAYFANVLFKFVISLWGARIEKESITFEGDFKDLRENELPVYTILLPLHREPLSVIKQLVEGIRQLDYPPEKLDVLFLIEENDRETLENCKKSHPPYNVRFILVPEGAPKTKPRACNFGLFFARGELLTIYDAEDVPEPDQLKKAVAAFRNAPPEFVCLQAALNFYNRNQNLLTRLFTLEYSYWFDYLLPGLFVLRLPIPLGGTSNHFKTQALLELGGWDPFNVTEDADLGMRASYRGYRVGIINSTTFEEANSKLRNWIRQRSRWLKGYLQTFLVHNRRPLRVLRSSGFSGWLTLQLFIGGTPLGQAASVPLWLLFVFWLFTKRAFGFSFLPDFIMVIGLLNLLLGNFLGIYLSMLAVFRRGFYELLPFALLNLFYWFLAGVAAWKGIFQLFTRPFFWEKTVHGLGGKQ
ncbi:glycosyltransferase family 2 protein [Atrimonas thermophila]|uniref:glycosyltransferase family 2 protein n=1 Tax=Atrimonas thermophila TaxID=3064161 RepID=UPI00399C9C06